MRVTEALAKDNTRKANAALKEPETVEMYMERVRTNEPINTAATVFESELHRGINSDLSVFDRKAQFRTNT